MKQKELIVWLDVDDVLLDFKGMYNKHLRENFNIKIKDNYVPKTWHYTEVLPKKIDFPETMKKLGPRWAGNQEALKGAAAFTQKIKKQNIKIILITHIEGEQGPDRIRCLVKNKIVFDEIYFTMGRTKSDFAKEIVGRYPNAVNLFIDDKTENVVDFIENVPNTVLGISLKLPFNDVIIASTGDKYQDRLILAQDYTQMYKAALKFIKNFKK